MIISSFFLVPLPISFTSSLSSNVLTVIAYAPPLMNLYSTYEFQLIFYDGNNENISYERIKVSYLQANLGGNFTYGLIPNLKHKIIFKHIADSIGYAQSDATILPSILSKKKLFLKTSLFLCSFVYFISICSNKSPCKRRI